MVGDRIYYLDSTRGLAALSVVGSHFFLAFGIPASLPTKIVAFASISWNGTAAVYYFFVLSGFVLTLQTLKHPQHSLAARGFASYVLSRLLRVYPAFWACWLITLLAKGIWLHTDSHVAFTTPAWLAGLWLQGCTWQNHLAELSLIFLPISTGCALIPQAWSLKYEVLISLLIPLLCVGLRNKPLPTGICILISCLFLRLTPYVISFCLGVLLSIYLPTILRYWSTKQWIIKFLVLLLGIFAYNAIFLFPKPSYIGLNDALCNLGSVILLMVVCCTNRLQILLNKKPLVFLGKISYSIYLIHLIPLILVMPSFMAYIMEHLKLSDGVLLRIIGICTLDIITVMLSTLSYYVFERPAQRLNRLLQQRFF